MCLQVADKLFLIWVCMSLKCSVFAVRLPIPAYLLALSYFALSLLSLSMLLGLRTKRTRLLLAWILLNLLLMCPEAGMVLFMAIYYWVSLHLLFPLSRLKKTRPAASQLWNINSNNTACLKTKLRSSLQFSSNVAVTPLYIKCLVKSTYYDSSRTVEPESRQLFLINLEKKVEEVS